MISFMVTICWNAFKDPSKVGTKPFHYDGDHERRRKEQLQRLYERTAEEVEEEEMLRSELKKIEARKREREKKTQDLQKLIAQADSSVSAINKLTSGGALGGTPADKKSSKKKSTFAGGIISTKSPSKDSSSLDSAGIKFPDIKSSGTSLRSSRMKLPSSLGQKKVKAVEQLLQEIGIEVAPGDHFVTIQTINLKCYQKIRIFIVNALHDVF